MGIGEAVYSTKGKTRVTITLNGVLVYFFDVWIGLLVGQDAILDMDFMITTGIRLDMGDETICLPDEVRIQFAGWKTLYSGRISEVKLGQYENLLTAKYSGVLLKRAPSER